MKNLFVLLLMLLSLVAINSCNNTSDLENQIEELESRLEALEQLTSQMNTNISALQIALTALQGKDYVTNISEITEGTKVIGYTISFEKSDAVTIYHGLDGLTPAVGIKQDSNSIFYWTLNGDWMTDVNGAKVRAQGSNGVTPFLKIEDGYWMISFDNGVSYSYAGKATGKDGDSFFKSVTQDENNVYLILVDGTTITLPKEKKLSITFDKSADISITAGASKTVSYTITGATGETLVKALGQNGWIVKVNPIDNFTGTITVTAPDPVIEDEILVWVYDGKNRTIMSSLNFVTWVIEVASNAYSLPKEATAQTVTVTTNIDYVVEIPEEAQSWLSVLSTRSTIRTETLTFNLTANEGFLRFARVYLKNDAGKILQSIAFEQEGGAVEVNVDVPGTLSSFISFNQKNKMQVVTVKGSLNNYDLIFLQEMAALTQIDMSGVTNTELLEGYFRDFANSDNLTNVSLPSQLTKIPDNAFYECDLLQKVQISESVEIIGTNAFAYCANLPEISLPGGLQEIGKTAFQSCRNLKEVAFPNSLKIIGNYAFLSCGNLKSISLPINLTTLGAGAFAYSGLMTLSVTSNISRIEYDTFTGCGYLTTVTLNEGLTSIGDNAFSDCNSLKAIVIPNSVTEIKQSSFAYSALETITLGANIQSIGSIAFKNTSELNIVNCKATTPPTIHSDTFTTFKYLYIPVGTKSLYEADPNWSKFAIIEEKVF